MSSIANIQNIIDEHKTSLPEGSYLELCKEMKLMFEERKKTTNNFYKLTYVCSNVKVDSSFDYEVVMRKKEKIVQMNDDEYENIKCQNSVAYYIDTPYNDFLFIGKSEDGRYLTGQDNTITITNGHIILAIEKL